MKKIGNLLKKYGFYIATAFVCVGALIAIFLMPNNQGNVKNEANPYAKNEYTDAKDLAQGVEEGVLEEDDLDTTDEITTKATDGADENVATDTDESVVTTPDTTSNISEEVTKEKANQVATEDKTVETDKIAATDETASQEAVEPETFESTTASTNSEPFFAEGDTFVWPVEGSVVVPYTDESTKHWFSESLNQTMRTFGICISAEEATEVKAVAKGTVTEIVDDSSSYLETGMPYVGKLMVIDHGNGYVSLYGFQRGEVNEQLVGQVVNAGDVLGSVGAPQGAFIGVGNNIYLQVMHNEEIVNPLNYLDLGNQEVKADSVDLGFAK